MYGWMAGTGYAPSRREASRTPRMIEHLVPALQEAAPHPYWRGLLIQISLIWGMLRSTQLSRVSSAYASRGLEPCSVAGGHVGHGEPVVQPAAARYIRRLRL